MRKSHPVSKRERKRFLNPVCRVPFPKGLSRSVRPRQSNRGIWSCRQIGLVRIWRGGRPEWMRRVWNPFEQFSKVFFRFYDPGNRRRIASRDHESPPLYLEKRLEKSHFRAGSRRRRSPSARPFVPDDPGRSGCWIPGLSRIGRRNPDPRQGLMRHDC